MDIKEFEDIRPYTNAEFKEAYYRLMEDPRFQDALRLCLQNYGVEDFRKDMERYQTIEDVQVEFDKRFLDVFLSQSTKGVSLSGIENLEEAKTYMFIGNHRDITLDPALLQYYFFIEKRKTSRIAMGDNLFTTPLLGEIAKLNKMIKVKRGGTMREKLVNFQKLAAYIQYSLFEEKESVWIAQRDGRTKDGNDYTKQGLLKMITMGNDKHLLETIRKMNITPITVSYEYESCDKMKARELALSENGPYVKQPGEDFESIKQGIFGQKGRVALTIGQPLIDEIDLVPQNLNNNDKLYFVCQLIDRQIYKNYVLYPNNYIAHDLLYQNKDYAAHYNAEEQSKFEAYLQMQSVTNDVPKEKMLENLLKIYATPVDNYMKTNSQQN
jgi:1-acyl-sn-glycerol-3-phosphate acyltransferase